MVEIKKYPRSLIIVFIKIYQTIISPYIGFQCRFYPSCSSYALEAIKRHGCFRGCYLIIHRILRCQPLSKGGNDPVPE